MRVSYSTLKTFNSCPRKFELKELVDGARRERTSSTEFGTAFGIAAQDYLLNSNKDQAIYKAWLSHDPQFDDKEKSWDILVALIERSFPTLDDLLQDWSVLTVNGKPAIELSFKITNILDGSPIYYGGSLDVALTNRWTNKVSVLDVKTTGLSLQDLAPLYKYSPQVLGYALALSNIIGRDAMNFDSLYLVGRTARGNTDNMRIEFMKFERGRAEVERWLLSLALQVENMQRMIEAKVFPQSGECLTYNRPCYYTAECNNYADIYTKATDKQVYEHVFTFEELINGL
jgi:hypothetical protein